MKILYNDKRNNTIQSNTNNPIQTIQSNPIQTIQYNPPDIEPPKYIK